ncbi:hypothetical protein VX159_07785 [Dechloromonas sp. ZY10]|uniref:hypothetical protein n=1 Tax=Dechloromonas aquae TaxID=2664436 RepID=UPI0035291587
MSRPTRHLLPLSLACAALLPGCASLNTPSPEEIARLPVVTYGQKGPEDGNFVLRYPAASKLPIQVSVQGSLLAQSDRGELQVQLKQDVYLYRGQLSFDGKTWSRDSDRVGGRFVISLPGFKDNRPDALSPGEMSAEFNLK